MFILDVRDGSWATHEVFGTACVFEGDEVRFPHVGYTIHVLQPGQANGMYHREDDQEDFLVLAGECLAIVEGEERAMKAWDFLHCPPATDHIFIGAGTGPCVIFMAGARTPGAKIRYSRHEVALRHGASVEQDTDTPAEAYARYPAWKPGRPKNFDDLPFKD